MIGRWRRSAADLAPVTHGLGSDPVGAVRAGCAFALELAGDRSAASQAALVAALDDVDPFVGETAWRALGSLGPLQAGTGRAWAGAAERFDGLGEGTD